LNKKYIYVMYYFLKKHFSKFYRASEKAILRLKLINSYK
jgi:hypothetical protein